MINRTDIVISFLATLNVVWQMGRELQYCPPLRHDTGCGWPLWHYITSHLADAFIQSNLQLIRLSRRQPPPSPLGTACGPLCWWAIDFQGRSWGFSVDRISQSTWNHWSEEGHMKWRWATVQGRELEGVSHRVDLPEDLEQTTGWVFDWADGAWDPGGTTRLDPPLW